MLTGKRVTLGVSGSIAAYKMANVASMLKKLHCDVRVILTACAAQFITPVTFETLTKRPCYLDSFDRSHPEEIHHLSLGQEADLLLVAPASADVIGKMAHGIADDLLTSAVVAATCPVLFAPAMNVHMYQGRAVQDNIARLKSYGYQCIAPEVGALACEAVGEGKLAKESVLVDAVVRALTGQRDLEGVRVLVTAGPTRESIDPVRYITNHSSGKMGYAIAERASQRGASVTLVTGPVSLRVPDGAKGVSVTTAEEMHQAASRLAAGQDIIIKAAAVADYRPKTVHAEKMKKKEGDLTLALERTTDILAELGKKKRQDQCVCGFSVETEELLKNSRAKLRKKNADLIAANSVREDGAGFGVDTNHLILITEEDEQDLGMLTKEACADALLDRLFELWKKKKQGE